MTNKRFEVLNHYGVPKSVYDREKDDVLVIGEVVGLLNTLHQENEKKDRIIKSQDAEISRQYKLCLAMSGILREEFGVYDVFDRTKDRKID